jgi:hypothetical protein
LVVEYYIQEGNVIIEKSNEICPELLSQKIIIIFKNIYGAKIPKNFSLTLVQSDYNYKTLMNASQIKLFWGIFIYLKYVYTSLEYNPGQRIHNKITFCSGTILWIHGRNYSVNCPDKNSLYDNHQTRLLGII